ncbi:DMT family transporter [Amylibacter sp. IMCC11727]|uniref:DMT family transporter n=1 Tax=Amylibacter sp. IMCC11727 TaxID=3039851 RepID=UPI00244DF1B6|nr:DMT family transporter [Amylibacter sp. IMCC11727]WGI21279.1 DMT family transporter [Amylibacter sp. IMCC11727]
MPKHSIYGTTPNTTAAPERDNWRGLKWMLLSVVASSAMTIAARVASQELDSRMVVLGRGLLTLIAILALLAFSANIRRKLQFTDIRGHLVRGFLIAISTQMGFYTIATVPLATTTVLFFTAPIFATVLAILIHGEKIGPRRIGAIVAGFAGVLIIMRPGFDALELGLITAIGSSLTFAMALTMSRNLSNADGPMSTYFSSVVIMVIVSIPIAAPVMSLPTLNLTWVAMIALVITSTIRGIGDIEAYRHADAALLTPITYLRLVFIGLAAYLFFGETPDGPTLIGATIIIAATLYIAQRERSLKAQK